jgi:hypothetical protein
MPDAGDAIRCAFCWRIRAEVNFMLVTERAAICDACIEEAVEAVALAGAAAPRQPQPGGFGFERRGLTRPPAR